LIKQISVWIYEVTVFF